MSRDELILSLKGQVEGLAARYARTTPIPYDDYVSAGWLAAIKAVDRFDPSKNIKLKTYSEYRVRGAMQDLIRSNLLYSSYESKEGPAKQVDLDKAHLKAPDEFARIEQHADVEQIGNRAKLSKKQKRLLTRLMGGLDITEISQMENTSVLATRNVKANLMKKMVAAR